MINKGKLAATAFLDSLELDLKKAANEVAEKSPILQHQMVEGIIKDGRELIAYNEWVIAIENCIDNLFESEFKISVQTLNLAKQVFKQMNPAIEDIAFLEELKK